MMQNGLPELSSAGAVVGGWQTRVKAIRMETSATGGDSDVWVKHENHLPTASFKVRGGLVWAAERDPGAGLAAATRGNHGQSIPYAARPHGIPVRVLVPEGNSAEKNAAMAGWGANIVRLPLNQCFWNGNQSGYQGNVQNRVSQAMPQLPEEVSRQGVTTKKQSTSMLLVVNLYSPNESYDGIFLSNDRRPVPRVGLWRNPCLKGEMSRNFLDSPLFFSSQYVPVCFFIGFTWNRFGSDGANE